MGDFALDTSVEPQGDGRYCATLQPDWEIWGPMGGYVSATAFRAAAAEATLARPVSYFCHFLRGTHFGPIELRVTPIRQGRSAESLRIVVTQDEREVIDATVCVAAESEGLDHEVTSPPDVPGPDSLMSIAEYAAEDPDNPPAKFWGNFDARPVHSWRDWPPPGPRDPVWRQWHRFVPASTFDDPWVDAARSVILCDLPSWPAATQHHAWKWRDQPQPWIAPTLDQYVAFHQLAPDEPWLLVDGYAPVATDGLLACMTKLWTTDGRLVASGSGQGLFRPVPGP